MTLDFTNIQLFTSINSILQLFRPCSGFLYCHRLPERVSTGHTFMEVNGNGVMVNEASKIQSEIESLEAKKAQIDLRISALRAQLNSSNSNCVRKERATNTNDSPSTGVSSNGQLSANMIYRYSRHLLLPSFGVEAQANLLNSSVLVIGAGGLGSPALLYLAACGVGT